MSGLNKALEKMLAYAHELSFEDIYAGLPDKLKKEVDPADLGPAVEFFLFQSGNTEQAVSYPLRCVISRRRLFSNVSFRIRLTPEELDEGRLIIGHRFQPFIHPGLPVEKLTFRDEQDRLLPLSHAVLPIDQTTGIYFNLLPPYGLTQYLENGRGEQTLTMAVIELKDWLRQQDFTLEDQILVSVKNYDKLEFYLEKLSSREIASRRIADRYYDKHLTEAIYEVFHIIGKNFLPVDMHLFWAFAQMDPAVVEKAGTPFGPFISQHESLTFFQEGPYAFLQDRNFMEQLMESAIQHAQSSAGAKAGLAVDLDGIFQEMGNSFSELLLRACMVEQLLEWDEIRKQDLHRLMFGEAPHTFYNESQQANFKRAFTKLSRSVKQKWKHRKLALPHLQLLRKVIQFKMEIIYLLRELNLINDPNQLNIQALLQIQPIDQSLDQILENILSKTPMPYQEAQNLVKQLDSGREKFLEFKADLLEQY